LNGEARPGLLVLIGMACLAGAAALAWFSSIQTLQLTRTGDGVTVARHAWLFGVVPMSGPQIENVRSVRTLTTIAQSARSRPFTRLLFVTPSGERDLWTTQSPFVRQSSEIEAFFKDETQLQTTFSAIAPAGETRRFVVAQLAVLFLAFCGGGVIYMAARSILGTNDGIV
jgi:hypothetical protein